VKLYSAADVTIVPSLQENLSNVILESLSCGTPVVGFKIGGNSDMIEHKINGYLAEPYQSDDLAYGIAWILNNENSKEISKMARGKVLENFDSKLVAKKYIELYSKKINKRANSY
jgi:glycosyltransferase involved in cell wall biosynthesis